MKKIPWLLAMFSPLAFGQSLPAFYGAEGGGALSVGGRGGVVCQVTNLNNSGAGSLRACVEMSGPRTVVFRVGGTINLTRRLNILNPYLTIAGHTAPGGGIQLTGKEIADDSLSIIATHNVIIRYVTFRKGAQDPREVRVGNIGMAFTHSSSTNTPNNIIIDHISSMWTWGTASAAWGWSQPTITPAQAPHKITWQNNIFAEIFSGHSVNVLTGASDPGIAEAMVDIDMIRNLSARSSHRHPLFKHGRGRVVNNIVYHWNRFATQLGPGMHGDVINNLYKHPNINSISSNRRSEIQVFRRWRDDGSSCGSHDSGWIQKDPSIYAAGNQGPTHGTDNLNMVKRVECEGGSERETLPAQYRRASPLAPVGVPITILPTQQLESTLLPIVGDSRRLDCMGNWVFKRDSQDARIIDHVQTSYDPEWETFGIYDENEVGGHPTIAGGTPCQDTDGDGMPDQWEDAMGLNKNDPSDRNQIHHPSGYTMLEVYLNGPMEGQVLTLAPPTNIQFTQ